MTTNTVDPAQPTASTVVVAADGSVTVTQVSNATTVTYPGLFSTPFSPIDLSPALWLDASDETTITESGGAVSQWDDKSGNGYHVAQGTSANQPTTGTRTVNGLNVIDFDGSNDSLVDADGPTFSQPNTIIVVAEFDDVSGINNVVDGRINAQRNLLRAGSNNFLMYAGSVLSGGSPVTATPYAMVATFDGVSSSLRVNGSTVLTGNVGTQDFASIRIGAEFDGVGQELDGAVGEIIIVNGTLTAQQIADTETYLADKWGITL